MRGNSPSRLTTLAFLITLLAATGCATTSATPTASRIPPTFNYTPPTTEPSGSADVTFAVVGADFEDEATDFGAFADFADGLANDFNEMLLARGFTVRGPYRTHDEMTYPEKEGSDLILTATISFTPDTSGVSKNEAADLNMLLGALGTNPRDGSGSIANFNLSGAVTINTRVTLVVAESITKERMWVKSISLNPIRVELTSSKKYKSQEIQTNNYQISLKWLLSNEAQFYTDMGRALASQYSDVMRSTWNYLDPNEMRNIKKQSLQVRDRKVYQ